MAKKFFHGHVHNTRRTIINFTIIGVCVIGIIICFIITSNFQGENQNKPQGELSLNNETTVEVNEQYTKDIFFSKIENVNLDDINIEYPEDFDISTPGEYEIKVTVGDESRTTKLKVVDTIIPELALKEVTIKENESYDYNDFVESCTDNSNKDCKLDYYALGTDEEGNKVDYSAFKKEGTYSIKIIATDNSGNENIKETKLTITSNKTNNNPKPEEPEVVNCKYGNNEYDEENYLIAVYKTVNECAVSLDLYVDEDMTKEINKMMETESARIQKDTSNLKVSGIPALNRKITVVLNKEGKGIVGYQLRMTVTVSNNDEVKTIADYKLDSNGKRVFISNDYNLPN